MSDDFVPERHLGLWTEEGRSEWAAIVRKTRHKRHLVTLERGGYNSSGAFVWRPELMLSSDASTLEQAREEAATAISRMVGNLLVIGASLRRDPDEGEP